MTPGGTSTFAICSISAFLVATLKMSKEAGERSFHNIFYLTMTKILSFQHVIKKLRTTFFGMYSKSLKLVCFAL